jgi:hypothetical protein
VNRQNDLLAKIDNFVVLAPGWKTCKSCLQVPEGLEIKDWIKRPQIGKAIEFNANNPNLKHMLAGGHGWLDPSNRGVNSKGPEVKMILPLPEGLNVSYITLTFRKIEDSSNYPSFSIHGEATNVKIHETNEIILFELPIKASVLTQGYLTIEVRTKNKAAELISATFN